MADQPLAPIGIAAEELPGKWSSCLLGELLEEVALRAKDVDGGEQLPVLSLTKNRGLIDQRQRFSHRVARHDVSEYKVVQRGWIVYNPMVLWEGAIAALTDRSAGLVSPVYAVWRAAGADSDYLDLLLKTPAALAEYERLASGVVKRRRTVKKQAFLGIPIPVPSLSEQRAIAHVLRTVQQAHVATDQVIAAGKELKRSLREFLYVNGYLRIEKSSSVETRQIAIGSMPAQWGTSPLRDLIREPLRNGKSTLPTSSAYGIPTLTLTAVTENDFGVHNTKLTVAQSDAVGDLWLEPGDIFVERANTRDLVGLAALYEGPREFAIFPDLLIRIRVDEKRLIPKFLVEYLLTSNVRRYFSKNAAGTAGSMPKINQDLVGDTPVPVPPREEQGHIGDALRAIDQKIAIEEQRQRALDALSKALLHDLMSARLRVPEDLIERVA
jgi:type I restriction enzyme, S subunit